MRLYLLIEGARWFPLRFESDLSLGGIEGSTSIYAPWACYIWLLSIISAAAVVGIIASIPPWGNSELSSSYLLISSSFFKFSSVTSKHHICHRYAEFLPLSYWSSILNTFLSFYIYISSILLIASIIFDFIESAFSLLFSSRFVGNLLWTFLEGF